MPPVVTRCHLLYHLLSLVVPLVVIRCHSLSLVVPLVVTRCHSLSLVVSLVVTRCTTRCHSFSFVVTRCTTHLFFYKRSFRSLISTKLLCSFIAITSRHGCSSVHLLRRVTRNFLGKGSFLGIRALRYTDNTRKKSPAGKKSPVFSPGNS